MALNVFGDSPASIVNFSETLSGGDDFRLAENIGESLIITVSGPKEVTTSYGVKTAIECPEIIRVSDGAKFTSVLIFNAAPVDQLRSSAGQKVLVTVDAYETKQGGKAPRFAAPSEAVQKAAAALSEAAEKAPF